MIRTCAYAVFALAVTACSSSNSSTSTATDAGSSTDGASSSTDGASSGGFTTSALDGTWEFTTLPDELLGVHDTSGSMVAAKGTYTLTFIGDDIGQTIDYFTGLQDGGPNDGGMCTVAKDQTVVSIMISGTKLTGTAVLQFRAEGSICATTQEVDNTVYNITGTQTTVATPTLTPYDGVWSITLADGTGSGMPDQTFTTTIAGGTWTATAPYAATGSVWNGMATATAIGGGSDFAAMRQ